MCEAVLYVGVFALHVDMFKADWRGWQDHPSLISYSNKKRGKELNGIFYQFLVGERFTVFRSSSICHCLSARISPLSTASGLDILSELNI